MPGRDADAARRSQKVGGAIRDIMRKAGVTNVELRKRIEKLRGGPVTAGARGAEVWVHRRTSGKVNLVQPEKVVYGPTADLVDIAKALGVDVRILVRAATKPDTAPVADNTDSATN